MNENLYLKAIETLNREKAELKDQLQLGATFQTFIRLLKKRKFGKIIDRIREKIILKRYNIVERGEKSCQPVSFVDSEQSKRSRIAVYTCVVGKYDLVKPPLISFENVDYFLYTDCPDTYSGMSPFQVRRIPDECVKQNNVLTNRFVKFHPKKLFGESYEYSIYIDGNVRIVSDVRPFVNCVSDEVGLAMHLHRTRQCIYKEALMCIKFHKGDKFKIRKQMDMYKKDGFPSNFGMNEANLIVANLNNPTSSILLDEWWSEFVRSESFRDQLAWPYVLWKHGLSLDDVGFLGCNIYKNYKVEIIRHE